MSDATIRYEQPTPIVARIVPARADKHNAINPQMIFELNDAFNRALYDELFREFVNLYKANKAIFARLNRVRARSA